MVGWASPVQDHPVEHPVEEGQGDGAATHQPEQAPHPQDSQQGPREQGAHLGYLTITTRLTPLPIFHLMEDIRLMPVAVRLEGARLVT